MPYLSIAQAALDRWRAATREMDAAEAESTAWHQAFVDAELAKADYQQAVDDATRMHRPVPIPFNEAADQMVDEPKTDMGAEGEDGEVYGG
jgi:hypothetical protein